MEEFKEIPGFPKYAINAQGEIWSYYCNRKIKAHESSRGGYKNVCLVRDGKNNWLQLHRLLALVFLDLPDLHSELEVDHIDGNPYNNRLSNLQVLTKEQHREKTRNSHGWDAKGSRLCSNCKTPIQNRNISGYCSSCKQETFDITEEAIVIAIREKGSWVQAAKQFGLSDNGLRKVYTRVSGGKDPKKVKDFINAL